MDSYITWPYQIGDHNCRITWVYNKYTTDINKQNEMHAHTCTHAGMHANTHACTHEYCLQIINFYNLFKDKQQ